MLDGMHPGQQLTKDKSDNEKKVTQRIHGKKGSVNLDEQAFEIFAFRKVQGYRMISRAGQAAHDARLAPGIQRRTGDDLLEQFQPDAA